MHEVAQRATKSSWHNQPGKNKGLLQSLAKWKKEFGHKASHADLMLGQQCIFERNNDEN